MVPNTRGKLYRLLADFTKWDCILKLKKQKQKQMEKTIWSVSTFSLKKQNKQTKKHLTLEGKPSAVKETMAMGSKVTLHG